MTSGSRYTLVGGGDLLLQGPIVRPDAHGAGEMWELMSKADHAFVNLEVALTSRGERADKISCFRADPALASELARANVSILTLANNHVMDYGITGLRDTIQAVRGAGLPFVGAGETSDEGLAPEILESKGVRVSFFGLSATNANGSQASDERPGPAGIRIQTRYVIDPTLVQEMPGAAPFVETEAAPADLARVTDAIERAKARSDLVVIGMHWGVAHGWVAAHQGELATYQRPLAHALIDAGADVIFGAHPHILLGVELYRDRPIFYSLGKLLFHPRLQSTSFPGAPDFPRYLKPAASQPLEDLGAIARITWGEPAKPPTAVELVPTVLDERGEPSPASREMATLAIQHVDDLSAHFQTSVEMTSGSKPIAAKIRPVLKTC